jgi:hypothetical protein
VFHGADDRGPTGYADVVVVRHPVTGWPARVAALSHGAVVVNGGDGVGEHPTRAASWHPSAQLASRTIAANMPAS